MFNKEMVDDYFNPEVSKSEFYERYDVTPEDMTEGVEHLIAFMLEAMGLLAEDISDEEFRQSAAETYLQAIPHEGGIQ